MVVGIKVLSEDERRYISGYTCLKKSSAMNTGVLMFSQISVFDSFIYIPKSEITESKGRSIFNF